jgi:hypothetical protein
MKNFRNKLLLLLGFVASISVASAVDKDNAFTPPALDSIESKQTTEGVTIGAVPYNTETLARTAFGKLNPYEHGILPVLVIVRNESKDAIRLSEMKVEFIDKSREQAEAIPANEVKYTKAPKRPSYGPGPIPGIRRKGKNPLAAEVIEVRGFAAKMLPPGESAYGFFYFQSGYRDGARLYLTGLQNASTGKDLFYFDIALD